MTNFLSDPIEGDKDKEDLSNILNSFVLLLDNSTSFDISYLYSRLMITISLNRKYKNFKEEYENGCFKERFACSEKRH